MPRTPDEFAGINQADGIKFLEDGYGLPGSIREMRYSDGYFYAKDAYGVFNLRHPDTLPPDLHINTHLGSGDDSLYVISSISPTINEDINDGYDVGLRWIDTTDGYEYVLIDNTAGSAIWINTTGGGGSTGGDELVKVSSNDTSAGYLENKIIEGYGIDISVENEGSNEQLKISITPPTCCGQILYSVDGDLTPSLPLTGECGWLINDNGILLIVG